MKIRHIYLGLCGLGIALPYSQFLPWLMTHRLDLLLMFHELFSTRIGGFFGLDVIVSAIVLLIFILSEGYRFGPSAVWLPIAATFLVGVSLGLPLFLYLRQRKP